MKKYVLRMRKVGTYRIVVERRYFGFLWLAEITFNINDEYDDDGLDILSYKARFQRSEDRALHYIASYCDRRAAIKLAKKQEKDLQKRLKTPIVVTCDHVNNI